MPYICLKESWGDPAPAEDSTDGGTVTLALASSVATVLGLRGGGGVLLPSGAGAEGFGVPVAPGGEGAGVPLAAGADPEGSGVAEGGAAVPDG
ncbi:hypothetical protein GCM10023075_52890 [Streptosporangium album]